MRRKITLYIADRLVDLDEQSFILLNYTMEDLTNPTIVKNSFSQQITIKGTANNNAIFGDAFRLDRKVGNNSGIAGADFNPLRKTPFAIYNEMNEVLESGYCRLDSATRKKGAIEYKITLFGGLGSFLYSLSYDDNGEKKSLASLDYLGTDDSDTELDFAINATNVAAAWKRVEDSQDVINDIWDVINFAPAYNGIPDGDFSADKAVVVPSKIGLQDTISGHTLKSGYALVNLSENCDEWSVKDLRSYLQRPVFSMRAFLEAVKKPSNNGGYVVNMPFLDKQGFGSYGRLWMTLPLLPSISSLKKASGNVSLSLTSMATSNHEIGRYNVTTSMPSGSTMSASITCKLQYMISADADGVLLTHSTSYSGGAYIGNVSVIFLQMVAYASNGSIIGGSKVKCIYDYEYATPSEMADRCGYVPPFVSINGDNQFDADALTGNFVKKGSVYQYEKELTFSVEAQDVAYYQLYVTTYEVTTYKAVTNSGIVNKITGASGGNNCLASLYQRDGTKHVAVSGSIVSGSRADVVSYTSSESLRSGALINKSMLLSTSNTPADYLLSFCKIFGLHILFDRATKEITILDRNDLYQDETIDLTKRIDLSQDINIVPFSFTSKWYDMQLESVGGAFAEEYESANGMSYGMQRINTGYEFNAEHNDIFNGNVFKNAVTILAKSKYFTMIVDSGHLVPSPFVNSGNTYTLWNSAGQSLDTDIPTPDNSASVDYYNENHPGYDIDLARKMEFRTSDNKGIDGANVLLFWEGYNTYPYFNLSDDVPAMNLLNDGMPCWILDPGASAGLRIPIFQRYMYGGEWTIDKSLDFGVPMELDIPSIKYPADTTIYHRFWRKYLQDRYDVNSKVMTCKVNFSGMQVGNNLLRKFYWFDNSLWVLNAIRNYSLTTYDPVECEFIQVQDKDNYLNGQMN